MARGKRSGRRPLLDRLALRAEWATVLYGRIWLRAPESRLKRWVVKGFLARSSAALNRGDFDVYLIGFRPDVEWRVADDLPGAGTYRGHPAIRAHLEDYFAQWYEFENRPIEVLAANPQRVAFTSELWARGARSGAEVTQPESYVVEMDRGWVVRLNEFRHRETALRALRTADPQTVEESGLRG